MSKILICSDSNCSYSVTNMPEYAFCPICSNPLIDSDKEWDLAELPIPFNIIEIEFPTDGRRVATLRSTNQYFIESVFDDFLTIPDKPVKMILEKDVKKCRDLIIKDLSNGYGVIPKDIDGTTVLSVINKRFGDLQWN